MPIKTIFLPLVGEAGRPVAVIGDALSILQAMTAVRVIAATDEKTGAVMQSGTHLVDHLREHGILASLETARTGGSSVGRVLGNWAHSDATDAVVVGVSHHSRLNEVVWVGSPRSSSVSHLAG